LSVAANQQTVVDILQLPVVGTIVGWRHARTLLQSVTLVIAAGLVIHGLFGPQIGPRNLSTVLTSIHWRGLLVVGLLVAGNVFCTACPMILARDAARRVVSPRYSWPRRFRRKWIGIALLAAVLFSYELFDLWELPAATAWVIVGYFAVAIAVDTLFKGASFCKYVCPIGQFNFIGSTLAPLEIGVRSAEVCRTCRTSDCIKGQRDQVQPLHVLRRGCELGLFLPTKTGNLDCTLCLDCVNACPHDNVALNTRVPGLELLETRRRSGIGRLFDRSDVAALAVVFTFGALVNAFAMTSPGYAVERGVASLLHVESEGPVLAAVFLMFLVLMPLTLFFGANTITRFITGEAGSSRGAAAQFAFALLPFGFGVWLAHYGFHLLTGVLTIVPVAQSAAIDLFGAAVLGEPLWGWTGMQAGAVYPIQLGFLILGACGSIALVQTGSIRGTPRRSGAAAFPWYAIVLALFITAVWILSLPMDMRGLGGVG
jgi:polyferredoxin